MTAPPDEPGRAAEMLRASRARVTASAIRQRRDIERRLHDGVQQDLIALAVSLQLAEAASSEPAEMSRLLAEMRRDVHAAIEAIRSLARDVYPPLLADLGLAAALRGLVTGSGYAVELDVPADRFPEDAEATVYFSCLDVIRLVGSSAAGGPVGPPSVRVWREGESLLFEVAFPVASTPLRQAQLDAVSTAVTDRVGAAGGALTTSTDDASVRLRGAIPLGGDPH